MTLFTDNLLWTQVQDGDKTAFEIFKRHYTYKKRNTVSGLFSGPGEKIVLLSVDRKALFVWRKERFRQDLQTGVNCAVFRNEGSVLSSELILQAEIVALSKWPGERLYTFVNPSKIESANPGYCFKKAGWKQTGITKTRKLLIFEKC